MILYYLIATYPRLPALSSVPAPARQLANSTPLADLALYQHLEVRSRLGYVDAIQQDYRPELLFCRNGMRCHWITPAIHC